MGVCLGRFRMTTKQYLQTYKRYEGRYLATIEQIKSIENEMISIKSPSFDDRVQTSPIKDPIGEMVCNLEREKGKLVLRLTDYRARMLVIKNQIEEMDKIDNDYYTILLLRYILNKDWKFICNNLCISRTKANAIHGLALLEFDKKYSKFYANK